MIIGAVLRPVNAQVFSRRALDGIHIADGSWSGLTAEIRERHYDVALIPTEKPQGYRIAKDAHIPQRIGFENGWGKPLKTLWIRRMCTRTVFRTAGLDPRAPHECDVVFSLARRITGDFEPPKDPRVLRPLVIDDEPSPDDRIAFQVTDKWQRLGATLEDVVDFAKRIAQRRDLRFIAAAQEDDYAQAFARAAGVSIDSFQTPAPWKNAIAAARAIVAPDSGAVHVAGMIGTPVVSCFAPSDFALQSRRWAPWAAPHRVLAMEASWPLVAADALEDLLRDSAQFSYTG
jgi:ADP-heptose:LPS heptosyltransferase